MIDERPGETFSVNITVAPDAGAVAGEPLPATVADGTGVATIVDNDTAGITVSPTSVTVAEAEEVLPEGAYLDPDDVHTPGIFVQHLVRTEVGTKDIEQRTVRPRVDP